MEFIKENELVLGKFERVPSDWPIRYALSTRKGGISPAPFDSLNIALHVGDLPENVSENRKRVCAAVKLPSERFVAAQEPHTGNVFVLKASSQAGKFDSASDVKANVDAIVTNVADITLMVHAADCALTMLFDPVENVLALVHSGWRGSTLNIFSNVVRVMQLEYGSLPNNIFAGIGPVICQDDFHIGKDSAARVARIYPEIAQSVLSWHDDSCGIDIRTLLVYQLRQLGVENIEAANICTACRTDLFYSHEKENNQTGRFGLFACITRVRK